MGALHREVVARGPEAALPQNLPDKWLRAIVRDIRAAAAGSKDHDARSAQTLAFVLADATVDDAALDERLPHCFAAYQLALIEELIGRQTGIYPRRYSLTDIFE
jgi:hypothetical protein